MTKQKRSSPKQHTKRHFPIVAVGASAGGLEAMGELLKNLPGKTGMAYVFILHLDPHRQGNLTEILSRWTQMKVQEARNLDPVKSDNVYIIPYDKNLSVIDGVLTLKPRQKRPHINMPIDLFFAALAERHKSASIGIVLSGTGSDGSRGLKAIKSSGGLTFAQDRSAKFDGMPRSAIAEGAVDRILSPKAIASELTKISQHDVRALRNQVLENNGNGGKEPRKPDDEKISEILALLLQYRKVDFNQYKKNTIRRRIMRRMLLNRFDSPDKYLNYIRKNPSEIPLLYQDLLINVTSFFRDADVHQYLKKSIFAKLIRSKSASESIRLWVPACSSGEEAYSLAIMLAELLTNKGKQPTVQVFATDISEHAIHKARMGIYTINELSDVSPARLQRFFTKVEGGYQVNKNIRETCIFAWHNVFDNPPFTRLDLISCCNLMIYLDTILQRKILSTFHFALNPGGLLVLGKSETIGTSTAMFAQPDKTRKIYTRKEDGSRQAVKEMIHRFTEPVFEKLSGLPGTKVSRSSSPVFEKPVEEILLAHHVPASVVVNKELDILQMHGKIGSFLELTAGKPSLNILKMARSGLAFEIRSAFLKAVKTGKSCKKEGIAAKKRGDSALISIEVSPVKTDSGLVYLIIFERQRVPVADKQQSGAKDKTVKHLREELASARDDVHHLLEEQQTGVEELQVANEEVVSRNEELQSINEELEISKEEIESTNEELRALNSELQLRNDELLDFNSYIEAVFYTVREPLLVLSGDLRIHSANLAFYRMFETKEEEIEGMLVYELFGRKLDITELRHLLEEIIPHNTTFNDFEINIEFKNTDPRTLLLNGRKVVQHTQRRQLILLALEDVTIQRLAEKKMREMTFLAMADNAPVVIWITDITGSRNFFNKTWYDFTHLTEGNGRASTWIEAIHADDRKAYIKEFEKKFKARREFIMEYRLRRGDGEFRWMLDIGKPGFDENGQFVGYIGTATEIHDKRVLNDEMEKQIESRTHELKEANSELARTNNELKQFAFVASHDLQEPLRKINIFIHRMRQDVQTGLSEKDKFNLDKILDASGRMGKLIDDLLDFSSVAQSDKKFQKKDLNKIIEEVVLDLNLVIEERNAKVTVDKLPVIDVVPVQISQLFHNLIGNALKFTRDQGPVFITVSIGLPSPEIVDQHPELMKERTYVEIIVLDNGIGFDQEFAEQIFAIFQRLVDRKKYPGTGMGLAICRRIVDNHGGLIYARSDHKGSAFHVILPVTQE